MCSSWTLPVGTNLDAVPSGLATMIKGEGIIVSGIKFVLV
jgi:hypothetical protein